MSSLDNDQYGNIALIDHDDGDDPSLSKFAVFCDDDDDDCGSDAG